MKKIILFLIFAFICILLLKSSSGVFPTFTTSTSPKLLRPSPQIIASPTPRPPLSVTLSQKAGWKRYVNSYYGYAIEYPETYSVSEIGVWGKTQAMIEISSPCEKTDVSSYCLSQLELTISATRYPQYKNLREYVMGIADPDSGLNPAKLSWTTINGRQVAQETGVTLRYYFFENETGVWIDKEPANSDFRREFDQITDTFTFTN